MTTLSILSSLVLNSDATYDPMTCSQQNLHTEKVTISRALCRIKLLPVTHVLVDTWMLTVKLVYKLSNVPDDLKWATNTLMTPFTLTFKV